MGVTRRVALQTLAAGAVLPFRPARARGERREAVASPKAVLYDATRCIGCRECVRGCAEANGWDADNAFGADPQLAPDCLTFLQDFRTSAGESFRKVQCMHCVEPACASACMLGAMHKDADGAVVWDADLCVGCRYCEIACPYNVPRFEWDSPAPSLYKCQMCPSLRAEGHAPACVEQCRRDALVYGPRDELIAEAHRRIDAAPDRYNPIVYGERDNGGTQVLYLAAAGVSFAELGLPALGDEPAAALPESIQHRLYKGMIAPLALFGALAAVVRRNAGTVHAMATLRYPDPPAALGGRLVTKPVVALMVLAAMGIGCILWRFVAGLGATTNLNDGYPMGLWIAFDVVTGTALACGGYAVALLVYIRNRGRYHPLVRPALVTSGFGYALGGFSVLVDIGRPWNFWKIPTFAGAWNFSSILLEVALCIMLYTIVLWIEISPAFLERWQDGGHARLAAVSRAVLPRLEKALPFAIALGMLLPTMHQSSLGSLMLIAGPRLHPLWHTPLLPLLFLISCIAMGYAIVTIESSLSARAFDLPRETHMLRGLARPVSLALVLYVAIRVADVALRGRLGLVERMDGHSVLFLTELGLFTAAALGLLLFGRVARTGWLVSMAALVVLGGGLYRFSTYLIAFEPGARWTYFPAPAEFAVTIGFVALEILGYLLLVKRFPILRAAPVERRPPVVPVVPTPEPLEPVPVGAGPEDESPAWKPSVVTMALLLVALSASLPGFVARANAQSANTAPPGDLRCLTRRAEDCLPQSVPIDEPHGAVCATCHTLWERGAPGGTIKSCTAAGCHERPETLTPFHRTVSAQTLSECTGCHVAHSFRAPARGGGCTQCHASGGKRATQATRSLVRRLPRTLEFEHAQHTGVDCVSCHTARNAHGKIRVDRLQECRSCHHASPETSDCVSCHDRQELQAITSTVTRTLDIRIGSLDRPSRTLLFEHGRHADVECTACHTGPNLEAPATSDCSSCHLEHHRATADCSACHDRPADGAHDRTGHLGCGGAGCHERVPAAIEWAPRTRQLCLACHTDQRDHRPGRDCADCHVLPKSGR